MSRAARGFLCAIAFFACDSEPRPIVDFAPDADMSLRVSVWAIALDPNVDGPSAHDILDGAHAWERALAAKCPLRFVLTDAGAMPTVKISLGELEPGRLGRAARVGDRAAIVLRPRPADTPGYRREFRVTVRHELGHVLGLDHRPDGVMASPTTSGITENDVAAVRCSQIATPSASANYGS